MKISMLMPVYNCPPDLLGRAIRSVMNQTYQDFEIVVVDGDLTHPAASQEDFSNLMNSLGSKLVYHLMPDNRDDEKKRSGFYMSLNRCMMLATGDVFSFLAGDDERGDIDTLGVVADRFSNHGPSSFLVYGDCKNIDREGNTIEVVKPGIGMKVSNPITFEEMLERTCVATPSVFWNRSVYNTWGQFNETYDWAADHEYWLRIWRDIDKEYLPKVIGHYRCWEISQNAKNGEAAQSQASEFLRRYKNGS